MCLSNLSYSLGHDMPSLKQAITVVGSQGTPSHMFDVLVDLTAMAVTVHGVIVRSGGAKGADTAAEAGVRKALVDHALRHEGETVYLQNLRRHLRVYLPYDGFRGHRDTAFSPYIDARKFHTYDRAMEIASSIHPAPQYLKPDSFALQAHTRNVFQVAGAELIHPSSALLCWAPTDKQGDPTGGTRTAWMLAKRFDIPCINLSIDSVETATQRLNAALYAMGNRSHASPVST
jgi:hypothetical protein